MEGGGGGEGVGDSNFPLPVTQEYCIAFGRAPDFFFDEISSPPPPPPPPAVYTMNAALLEYSQVFTQAQFEIALFYKKQVISTFSVEPSWWALIRGGCSFK